jgi:DNA-binding NtrC family response regulator
VIDRKQHIRTFLCDALEELGFITRECGQLSELDAALNAHCPDLIVLGVSAGGQECGAMLKILAAKEFGGNILLLGARASPMLASVQELGEKLGLAMLPVLPTPFGNTNLRDSVATLLPVEPPPLRCRGSDLRRVARTLVPAEDRYAHACRYRC